jgi:hypothetical protein
MIRIYWKHRTTGMVGATSAKTDDSGRVIFTWVDGVFYNSDAFYKLYYLVDYSVFQNYHFNFKK